MIDRSAFRFAAYQAAAFYTNLQIATAKLLQRALDKAEINAGVSFGAGPVPTQGAPKGTLLYDDVWQASNTKLSRETGRKAIILLTDGGDQGSIHKIQDAIEAAQKSNAMVYVILIADRGFYGSFSIGYGGAGAMDRLTRETGGRVINVGNNGKKLEDAFSQISDELRTQYLVSYTPQNTELDGTFRPISISCGKDAKVQARKGYYAMADASAE